MRCQPGAGETQIGVPHFKASLGDMYSANSQRPSLRLVKVPVTPGATVSVLTDWLKQSSVEESDDSVVHVIWWCM